MRIVFRADASSRIGTGHVTRCATLARALQSRGAQTRFVCREHPGNLIAALRSITSVAVLPAPPRSNAVGSESHADWLGVPEATDAEETAAALHGARPEWLVVDHYALGLEWEQRLRPHASRIVVIDDLANRRHDCDALLDVNFSQDDGRSHRDFVPESCRLLSGPRYALLAPEYAAYREARRPRDGVVNRVLIYFGGADPPNMTGQALAAISGAEFLDLAVDLVIGTNHPHREALELQAAARPGTYIHGTRPHLADLMDRADLAIGAGGTTTWERMCLGLPSVVVAIAENQRPTCEALAEAGLIQYVGDVRSVGSSEIQAALTSLLGDRERLTTLAARGRSLVDGYGAPRVADVFLGRSSDDLIRTRDALHEANVCPEGFDAFTFAWIDRCRADDVLALRNMPHVTIQMRSQDAIDKADHQKFLDAYDRMDRYDFILVDNSCDRYVGAFYVTNLSSSPEIGKYIGEPAYIGKGIARIATQRLIDFCRSRAGVSRLTSMTRRDNLRNITLNTRLGFRSVRTEDAYVAMTLEL